MENQTNGGDAMFRELASRKLEEQGAALKELEEKTRLLPEVLKEIRKLASSSRQSDFPQEEIRSLKEQLRETGRYANRLLNHEIPHKHKINATVWTWFGMAVLTVGAMVGWINASGDKGEMIANDTKYRMLQIDTANKPLQEYLIYVDSVYRDNDDIREWTLKEQETMTENIQRLRDAEMLDEEAKRLRKEAGKN